MSEAAQLDAFLAAMTQYAPTIPDELVDFYLQQAGCTTNDVRITRLVSLVAHKLLLDVTHDAMQYHRLRAPATAVSAPLAQDATTSSSSSTRAVLTMDDLSASLKEYGVNICRPEYMSDVPEDPAL